MAELLQHGTQIAVKKAARQGASGGLAGADGERNRVQKPDALDFQFQPDQATRKKFLTERPFRLIPGLENTAPPPALIALVA
jgi:hypothetical protein